jgi:hypothetical protein
MVGDVVSWGPSPRGRSPCSPQRAASRRERTRGHGLGEPLDPRRWDRDRPPAGRPHRNAPKRRTARPSVGGHTFRRVPRSSAASAVAASTPHVRFGGWNSTASMSRQLLGLAETRRSRQASHGTGIEDACHGQGGQSLFGLDVAVSRIIAALLIKVPLLRAPIALSNVSNLAIRPASSPTDSATLNPIVGSTCQRPTSDRRCQGNRLTVVCEAPVRRT